jgi:hypothetical protein
VAPDHEFGCHLEDENKAKQCWGVGPMGGSKFTGAGSA